VIYSAEIDINVGVVCMRKTVSTRVCHKSYIATKANICREKLGMMHDDEGA